MSLKSKIGTFVAAVAIIGAVSTAPASAASSFKIPSGDAASLCKQIKQPSLQATCTKLVSGAGSGDIKSLLSGFGVNTNSLNPSGFNITQLLSKFNISKIVSGLKL